MKLFALVPAFFIAHFYWLIRQLGKISAFLSYHLNYTHSKKTPAQHHNSSKSAVWAACCVTYSLPWLDSCLIRSLTTATLLRALRTPYSFHIGVRKSNEELEAHVWVALPDGTPLCDGVADLASYTEMPFTSEHAASLNNL